MGDGADVCVTEGVMGLFDGYQRMQGSSAEIARLLNIPVVLIVSARSTAYSVAPLIYGFKHFNPAVKIAGIVFNQVSSPSHFAYLREACVDAGVECLGYLAYDRRVENSIPAFGFDIDSQTFHEHLNRTGCGIG